MKFILLITTILFSSLANAQFVHPLNFDGSEAQKKEVITYITNRVKHDYCGTVDMCQQVMLRLMEKENLDAFKRLTKAKNRDILDRAIHDYCGRVDMCTYQMIEIMYNQNVEAADKKLDW
ncbi:hypothetical protein [Marinomonas sp.]|uniref:hypothetical protein n=1 Tax=Marinomonas sp. TaxID=1904862 RepID=UPI003BAB7067